MMMNSGHTGGTVIPERCDCQPGDMVGGRYVV